MEDKPHDIEDCTPECFDATEAYVVPSKVDRLKARVVELESDLSKARAALEKIAKIDYFCFESKNCEASSIASEALRETE